MSHHPPPVMPPFDEPDESIEGVVQQHMDMNAAIKLALKQNSQLAARQAHLDKRFATVEQACDRIIDTQLVVNGVLSLMVRRQRRQMEKDGIADDLEEREVEEQLMGRMR